MSCPSIVSVSAVNAQYVEAYNRLLACCKQHGLLTELNPDDSEKYPPKSPKDSVSNLDLERMRHAIRNALSSYIDMEQVNLTSSNAFSDPNAQLKINNGKGFLTIPAKYSSTGKDVYEEFVRTSGSIWYSNAPVLWLHFTEIAEVLNKMNYRKVSGSCQWYPEVYQHGEGPDQTDDTYTDYTYLDRLFMDHFYYYYGDDEFDYIHSFEGGFRRRVQATITDLGVVPASGETVDFYYRASYHTDRASSSVFYNPVSGYEWKPITNVSTGIYNVTRHSDFDNSYVQLNATVLAQKKAELRQLCESMEEDYWYDCLYLSLGCDIDSYQFILHCEHKVTLPDPQRTGDDDRNGIVASGCDVCADCDIIKRGVGEIFRRHYGKASWPIGMSGLLGNGFAVGHCINEYDLSGCKVGHYNCDTSVLSDESWSGRDEDGDPAEWAATVIRRPLGASVTALWLGGDNTSGGKAELQNGCSYEVFREDNLLHLKFEEGRVEHIFDSQGLLMRVVSDGETLSGRLPGEGVSGSLSNGTYTWVSPVMGTVEFTLDANHMVQGLRRMPETRDAVSPWGMTSPGNFSANDYASYASAAATALGIVFDASSLSNSIRFVKNGTQTNGVYMEYSLGSGSEHRVSALWATEGDGNQLLPLEMTEFLRSAESDGTVLETRRTVKFNSGSAAPAVTEKLRYRDFGRGDKLLVRYHGSGAEERTTQYEYYPPFAASGGGKLAKVTDGNGRWTRYEYDAFGRVVKEVRPFMDAAADAAESLCSVTLFDYTLLDEDEITCPGDARPRTVVKKDLNVETGREYHLYFEGETRHITASAAGALWNAAGNRVERSLAVTSGNFAGRHWKTEYPDGTSKIDSYSLSGGTLTVTTQSGFLPGDGSTTVRTYDSRNNLVSERTTDIGSSLLTGGADHDYDDSNRLVGTLSIDGLETLNVYNCCGLIRSTDESGSSTDYVSDHLGRLIRQSHAGVRTETLYDSRDNEISRTVIGSSDGELTSSREYDTLGRLKKTVDELGNEVNYSYGVNSESVSDELNNTVHTLYYLDGRVKRVYGDTAERFYEYGVENGERFTREYDSADPETRHLLSASYLDFQGRAYKTVLPGNLTRTTTFDALGRTATESDTAGNLTTYSYDSTTGKLVSQCVNTVTTSFASGWRRHGGAPDGEIVRYEESSVVVNNVPTVQSMSESSRNGLKEWRMSGGYGTCVEKIYEKYEADGEEELLSGDVDGVVTVRTEEDNGHWHEEFYTDGVKTGESDSRLGTTDFVCDEFNREIGYDRTENGYDVSVRRVLDDRGNVLSETHAATPSAGGTQVSRTHVFSYNAAGLKTSSTTPEDLTTSYTYNSLKQIAAVSGAEYYRSYAYDGQGRLVSLTTRRNASATETTTFEYDLAGRLTKRTYPDGNYEVYAYTADGRPASVRNARGGTTLFAYNAANMLASLTGSNYSWTFQYDGRGLLTTASSGTFSMTFAYDQYGKKVSESRSDITGTQVARTYDNLQRPSGCSFDGVSVTYTYDNTGRMSAVGCGDLSFEYSRVADTDRISQIVAKNNAVTVHTAARTYSPFGELLSQSGYAYTLDSDGRRTAAAFDGKNWAYSYDGLNQLTGAALTEGATPLSSHAYSYDEIGNRLTSTLNGVTTSYTANDLNQYTAVGNVTPTYDDDGNMLTDGTMTYQYDVMNQLISAETATEKYTFKYDFEGRRYETRKWTRSGGDWTLVQTMKYVYDNWNVIAEYVNGVKAKTYVWGEDLSGTMQSAGGVGGLLAEINASGAYLPVCDGNGNILSYKDLSGNTAATYAYDPFGNVLAHTGTDFAYKFSTKPETCGLYYYGFRYYHPALGRWINRDTLKEQGGMNLYLTAGNNLVCNIDNLGLDVISVKGMSLVYDVKVGLFREPKGSELGKPGSFLSGEEAKKRIANFTPEEKRKLDSAFAKLIKTDSPYRIKADHILSIIDNFSSALIGGMRVFATQRHCLGALRLFKSAATTGACNCALKFGYECAAEVSSAAASEGYGVGCSGGVSYIYSQAALEAFFDKINDDCIKKCSGPKNRV